MHTEQDLDLLQLYVFYSRDESCHFCAYTGFDKKDIGKVFPANV